MLQSRHPHSAPHAFSSIGLRSGRPSTTPAPTPLVDLSALQAASRTLHDLSSKDAVAVPDLGDLITLPGRPSSGTYSVFPDDHRAPFLRRRIVPIPDDVYNYLQNVGQNWSLGILPEIERVWFAIDSQLVLWDYMEGKELDAYTEQQDLISHVALVKPRPGVFIEDIHHLLVICTPLSVVLLGIQQLSGVGPSGRPRKELKMYETNMKIATEVEMTSVAGTADGRIFMAGAQDGHLYELHYQEQEGWFGKKIQLVNHSVGGVQSLLPSFSKPTARADRVVSIVPDDRRSCFYTLTERNVISIYKPAGEKAITHIQTLSHLYQSAQDRAPGSPALSPSSFKIVGIHAVDPRESRNGVQLVAVTSNGVRLYFSPAHAGYSVYYGTSSSGGGGGGGHLQLLHVRLPPTDLLHPDEQTAILKGGGAGLAQLGKMGPFTVTKLDSSCYGAGITMAAQPGDREDRDFLLCMSADLTRIAHFGQPQPPQPDGMAYANTLNVIGPTGPERPGLVEIATLLPNVGRTYAVAMMPRPGPHLVGYTPNELATQFCEPPQNIVVLTNSGVTFVTKRRAVDWLMGILDDLLKDGNPQPVFEFRDSFGRDQTCAMLLALASGNTFLDIGVTSPSGSDIASTSPELANIAKQVFYDLGDRPIWSDEAIYGSSSNVKFSGRREGLALYLARLTRPILRTKLLKPNGAELNISEDVLLTTQRNLHALKALLDQNPQIFQSAPGDHDAARAANAREQDAWKLEQKSVSELQSLLARTVEAISFVSLLHDHKEKNLFMIVDPETQRLINSLTFEDLITAESGIIAARALVNVLIDNQASGTTGVDAVSDLLQSKCGSFCSTDDVMLYKAKESVRKAAKAKTEDPTKVQVLLEESLRQTRLFVKAVRMLDFENLGVIIVVLEVLDYARGAIELPLYSAQAEDADDHGRAFWHAGCPANDPRSDSWERRRRCYDLVLHSLSVFDEKASASLDLDALRNHAYDLAFATDDEMFHSILYDWLIERGHADELLESRPPYLEAHFRREPVTVDKYQLLWQYYVKDGQSLRAAEVLGALAESPQFHLTLARRVECLTLAVGNAKSHPVSGGAQHESALAFLQDLEEKLEVAQIQLELYNHLSPRENEDSDAGRCIQNLHKRLYNVTEIYQDVVEPFDLPDFKLMILHISEHRDENLTNSIWNQIFEDALGNAEDDRAADRIALRVVPLGRRFYPSDDAFPVRHVARLLVRFALANKGSVPHGWGPRVLVQCGVPYPEVWDIYNEMYESQVPPFNEQANVQAVSSDIAVFLADWTQDAARPETNAARDLPVHKLDRMVDVYISELAPNRVETKATYEAVKRALHRYW